MVIIDPAGTTTELAPFGTKPLAHDAGLDHKPPNADAVAVFTGTKLKEKTPGQALFGVGQVSNRK